MPGVKLVLFRSLTTYLGGSGAYITYDAHCTLYRGPYDLQFTIFRFHQI